ncbi:MAG: hypothetical protein J0H82_04550 [Alphaproteobacteria bacterium]|jgi:hypothetical protein|nr:hypothetical protein [Alphaproteobacteria bacterium]
MAAMRMRNALLAFKLQGAEGTAAALTAATDAVKVENIQIKMNPTQTDNNELSGGLDMGEGFVGGMSCDISFDIKLAGSAAAGTAPDWGKIMRAMGWAETITAAAVPVAPEACAAGSTTTATLGAGASATAGTYAGMPIVVTGTAAGTYAIIDYSGSKVATLGQTAGAAISASSNYQIPVNVLYTLVSSAIGYATIGIWRDGVQWLFQDCRGGWSIAMKANAPSTMSCKLKGIFVSHIDAAVPTIPAFTAPAAPVWKAGEMLMNRLPARVSTFNIDSGISPVMPDDPNATEGFGAPELTSRKVTATLDPLKTLVATRDLIGALRAGTKYPLVARCGSSAGNRLLITAPAAKVMGDDEQDRQGLVAENVNLHLVGTNSAVTICVY